MKSLIINFKKISSLLDLIYLLNVSTIIFTTSSYVYPFKVARSGIRLVFVIPGSVFTSSNILHQLLQVVTGLNIPKYYAYFGIFMTLISVILMIVLKSRRPLHDLFADTREVYLESNDYTYYQKKRKKVKRKSGK